MTTTTKSRPQAQTVTTEQPAAPEPGLLDGILAETADRLDRTVQKYQRESEAPGLTQLRKSLLLAAAREQLDAAITPQLLAKFLHLMNTPLGFKTDKPNKRDANPYDAATVKRCLVDAFLMGLRPLGNEFNIISGSVMTVLNGWRRKLAEVPGLTDLKVSPGVPRVHEGQTVVRVAASWKVDGKADCLVGTDDKPGRVFAVPVYESQGPDAAVGKAERRALKAVYQQVTGCVISEPDDDTPAEARAAVARAGTMADAVAQDIARRRAARDGDAPHASDEALTQQVPERQPGEEG